MRDSIVQKWVSGNGRYFPFATVVVKEDDGGSILEIRYSSPPFYVFLGLVSLLEFLLISKHQWAGAVLLPALWGFAHMFSCLFYQIEKERLAAKIRDIL
jgi:hypothetical protein